MTAYVLSDSDRRITREVADKVRRGFLGRGAGGKGGGNFEDVQNQAPDVYIARTPPGGISGLSITNASDTGTSTDSLNSVFSVECQIYRLTETEYGADLEPAEDFTQVVHNIHEHAIPGNLFTLIARTKDGSWIALPFFCCGSSNDDGFGTETGTGTGTGTGSGTGSVDGGTNTGTGTGTNNNCPAISLTERDVQCESGQLNIYSRTILLDIIDGCLTKVTGAWTYERTEGVCGTVTINFTNINDFLDYFENVFYYNTYDNRLCVNIGGFWYCWCPCYEDTGTGTSGGTPGGSGCCDASSVTVQVTGQTGTCTCFASSYILARVGSTQSYTLATTICGFPVNLEFDCDATCGLTRLRILACGAVDVAADSGCSCDPIMAVFSNVTMSSCCSGTATFTVVE